VSRWRRCGAVLVSTALAVLVAATVLLVTQVTARHTEPGPLLGAVLDGSDRRALAALPIRRGAAPPPVDPAVDLTDPQAVARAYLGGARAARSDDSGHTHLQAAGYAAPGSPPAAVGLLVLDPPPPGQVRTATVTALDLVAEDDADLRRAYRATITTTTGPARGTPRPPGGPAAATPGGPAAATPGGPAAATPGGPAAVATTTAYVVLARQPDGRWLVTADTPDLPEGDD
jgi:hypothetical protein